MLDAGFSEDDVRTVAVTNTRRMAGLEVADGVAVGRDALQGDASQRPGT